MESGNQEKTLQLDREEIEAPVVVRIVESAECVGKYM